MKIVKDAEGILFEGDELLELRSNSEREEVLIEPRERRMEEGQLVEIEHEWFLSVIWPIRLLLSPGSKYLYYFKNPLKTEHFGLLCKTE